MHAGAQSTESSFVFVLFVLFIYLFAYLLYFLRQSLACYDTALAGLEVTRGICFHLLS